MPNLLDQETLTELIDSLQAVVANAEVSDNEATEAIYSAILDVSRHTPEQEVYETEVASKVITNELLGSTPVGYAVYTDYKPIRRFSEKIARYGTYTRGTHYEINYLTGAIWNLSMPTTGVYISYEMDTYALDLLPIYKISGSERYNFTRVTGVECPLNNPVPFSVWGNSLFPNWDTPVGSSVFKRHIAVRYEAEHTINSNPSQTLGDMAAALSGAVETNASLTGITTTSELESCLISSLHDMCRHIPLQYTRQYEIDSLSLSLDISDLDDFPIEDDMCPSKIRVVAVEYPVDQYPRKFINYTSWGDKLLLDTRPTVGSLVRVYVEGEYVFSKDLHYTSLLPNRCATRVVFRYGGEIYAVVRTSGVKVVRKVGDLYSRLDQDGEYVCASPTYARDMDARIASDGKTLHIVSCQVPAGTSSLLIVYHKFDLSTEKWVSSELVASFTNLLLQYSPPGVSISLSSDDTPYITYSRGGSVIWTSYVEMIRLVGGEWTTPEVVFYYYMNMWMVGMQFPCTDHDSQDSLHTVIRRFDDLHVMYRKRSSGGTYGDAYVEHGGESSDDPKIMCDSDNNPHITYHILSTPNNHAYHQWYDGSWHIEEIAQLNEPYQTAQYTPGAFPLEIVGRDIHIIYPCQKPATGIVDRKVYHLWKPYGGSWSDLEVIYTIEGEGGYPHSSPLNITQAGKIDVYLWRNWKQSADVEIITHGI